MKILNVADEAFKAYGKVVKGLDVSDLLEALKETPKPDDVIYVASDEKLEACPSVKKSNIVCMVECPFRQVIAMEAMCF